MPDDTKLPESDHLPAERREDVIPAFKMPPAMALWFDDRLFDRARVIAKYIAEAEGFTPKHLVGKPAACFAVVERALTWKLSPYAVAQSTYETPGGRVGFEGKLCQAILENSGQLEGGVTYEEIGEWDRLTGKFKLLTGNSGKPYPAPDWKPEEEKGLGVIVRCQVRGEQKMREFKLMLVQAFPRNSTLWATDPRTQLKYLAVRRFSSVAAPGLFMGVPFDREDESAMVDVTPRPQREDYVAPAETEQQAEAEADKPKAAKAEREQYEVVDAEGEVHRYPTAAKASSAFEKEMEKIVEHGGQALEDLWEANGLLQTQLRETGKTKVADMLAEEYRKHIEALDRKAREAADAKTKPQQDKGSTATPSAPRSEVSPSEGWPAERTTPAASSPQQQQSEPKRDEPKAAQKLAGVPWTWRHTGYMEVPVSPLNGGGRMRFVSWLCDMLREMPEDQITSLLEAYAKEIAFYREKLPDDYRKVADIAKGRGFTL